METNRIKVTEIGHHLYDVKLGCGYAEWEIIRVRAINEFVAFRKAMRGRKLKYFIIRGVK